MIQLPVSYIPFKVVIAWFQTHYCHVKTDVLFEAKANYISENSEKMARKIPGVCVGVRVPPPGAKIICSWAQALCSGYPWPGQLHL